MEARRSMRAALAAAWLAAATAAPALGANRAGGQRGRVQALPGGARPRGGREVRRGPRPRPGIPGDPGQSRGRPGNPRPAGAAGRKVGRGRARCSSAPRPWPRRRRPCTCSSPCSSFAGATCTRPAARSTAPSRSRRGCRGPRALRRPALPGGGARARAARVGSGASRSRPPRSPRAVPSSTASTASSRRRRPSAATSAGTSRCSSTARSPRRVARTALRLLEEATTGFGASSPRPPQHDVPVILYSRELFDEITRTPGLGRRLLRRKDPGPGRGLADAAAAERLGPILAQRAHPRLHPRERPGPAALVRGRPGRALPGGDRRRGPGDAAGAPAALRAPRRGERRRCAAVPDVRGRLTPPPRSRSRRWSGWTVSG